MSTPHSGGKAQSQQCAVAEGFAAGLVLASSLRACEIECAGPSKSAPAPRQDSCQIQRDHWLVFDDEKAQSGEGRKSGLRDG